MHTPSCDSGNDEAHDVGYCAVCGTALDDDDLDLDDLGTCCVCRAREPRY